MIDSVGEPCDSRLLLLSIAPFFGAYALLADAVLHAASTYDLQAWRMCRRTEAKKDWPILLYGAGGWWLALLMRVPVVLGTKACCWLT